MTVVLKTAVFDELHWLDIPQRVQYKLCATVHRCLQHKAPQHMTDCCIHTSDIAPRHLPGGRQHRTTVHDGLLHPHLRHCSSPASVVRRLPSAVCTATPAFDIWSSGLFCSRPGGWNSLPDYLRDPSRSFDSFRRYLVSFLFSFY